MSNKSAVDFLFERLWEVPKDKFVWYGILKEAKEMEKDEQLRLIKYSRDMCTDKAPIKYIIDEYNKYGLLDDDSDNVEYKTKTK